MGGLATHQKASPKISGCSQSHHPHNPALTTLGGWKTSTLFRVLILPLTDDCVKEVGGDEGMKALAMAKREKRLKSFILGFFADK